MELNKCSCGAIPKIIIKRNIFIPDWRYAGKVVCKNCGAQTSTYGMSNKDREFLIERWNRGYVLIIDEYRNVGLKFLRGKNNRRFRLKNPMR